jgi:hypothetical protein
MWISKKQYTDLIDRTARAEAARDFALAHVNVLQTEVGQLKLEITGRPQPVPRFKLESQKTVDPEQVGETSFEDLGDDEARRHGYKE